MKWGLALAMMLLVSPIVADDEARVSAAVRAALLGNSGKVSELASAQRAEEKQQKPDTPTIAENLAVLAAATRIPTPNLKEKRAALKGHRSDATTRAFDRILRLIETRQRYREALGDRRYEEQRSVFNALASPIAGLAQGQFFPLFALPFDGAKFLIVGRRYATPEERREFRTGRTVAARFPDSPEAIKAGDREEKLAAKRRRTAILEARSNADRAMRDERFTAAHFWYGRELAILEKDTPAARRHQDLLNMEARRALRDREAVVVVDGERLLNSTSEVGIYTELVRLALLADLERFPAALTKLRTDFPGTSLSDDAAAAEAGLAMTHGDAPLAGVLLKSLQDSSDAWGPRARELSTVRPFDPEPALARAEQKARNRRNRYVTEGRDPQVVDRSFSGEEARLSRGSVIDRARVLFVTDALARLLFLPLTDPVPRPELLAEAAATDPSWFDVPAYREWLKRWAWALRNERRHEEAARLWDRHNEPERAAKARERAARHLERLGDRADSQALRTAIYTRLLSGYAVYTRRERVSQSLESSRRRAIALATINPKELERWPELLRALELDSGAQPRVDREGLLLLPEGLVAWRDRKTKRWIEQAVDGDRIAQTIRMLEPRRRLDSVREETRQPLPRKRIPLALEAGVYPGLEVFPGLVPLEPDGRERSLYE